MNVTLASRYLVPDAPVIAPEGFTRIDSTIQRGLPHELPLAGDLRLLVIVPSGMAKPWRDADPSAIVTSSAPDRAPAPVAKQSQFGDLSRPPARLLLQSANQTVAAVPLVAGLSCFLPEASATGISVEVLTLDWDIRAGTLVGAGNFGSRISIAWRMARLAVTQFSEPPPNPIVIARLLPKFRLESTVGLERMVTNRRFTLRGAVLR
jgi:hypothetical protein